MGHKDLSEKDLLPYSGSNPIECPKCGHTATLNMSYRPLDASFNYHRVEHMNGSCARCGFDFKMHCYESKKKEKE